MFLALARLDQAYREKFGHRISFNDASLQFGGLLDNKTFDGGAGGRDSLCHVSHHRGVDIDLNSVDEGGDNIRNATYLRNGKSVTIIKYVDSSATGNGLERVVERNSIHFRLKASRVSQ